MAEGRSPPPAPPTVLAGDAQSAFGSAAAGSLPSSPEVPQSLIEAVQRNCHITDARHARNMTLCTYLLEMREFFRWEQGLAPGQPVDRAAAGRWIAQREGHWDDMMDDDFAPISVAGEIHDAFAAVEINALLNPQGLVYGAGIGRFGKPHFFLGRLEKSENIDGLKLLVVGREFARDLTAIPAALQGSTVVVRRESLSQWLWEKAEAWQMKRHPGPLARALALHGFNEDAGNALQRMTDTETATLILHERGEFAAAQNLGPVWEERLAGLCSAAGRRGEILLRAVRDHLADALVTLPALLESGSEAPLHFWFANLEGMRRELAPALVAAYEVWQQRGDGTELAKLARRGQDHWLAVARRLLAASDAAVDQYTHQLEALALA